jgi:hypothetical protein
MTSVVAGIDKFQQPLLNGPAIVQAPSAFPLQAKLNFQPTAITPPRRVTEIFD